jgi:hypothetical protein
VVGELTTRPKGRALEVGQGDGFLRVIKIRSTPFFGREVKPEKILQQIRNILESHGDE